MSTTNLRTNQTHQIYVYSCKDLCLRFVVLDKLLKFVYNMALIVFKPRGIIKGGGREWRVWSWLSCG